MSRERHGQRSMEITRREKVLFPRDGITKGDVIDYYVRVADQILPGLRQRPLVLQRFPDGIEEEGFYQKQVQEHFPDWISTAIVGTEGGHQMLVVCNEKATLAWLANQGCLALHPWLSRTDRLDHPDQMVIDFDPPAGDFEAARRAAFLARDLLAELGLHCYPRLTGSRGIHIVVPLDRSADFTEVRHFARAAMDLLVERRPEELTTEIRKDKRCGRLFLDTGRNAWAQTAVVSYSLRPLPGAPVATPLRWDELERRDIDARKYTMHNLFQRMAQLSDDPWAGMARHACGLEPARRRLERLKTPTA